MDRKINQLRQFIVKHYSLDELRTLCFDLSVLYDDLDGAGISARAGELILYMGRHQRLHDLLTELSRARPESFHQAGFRTNPDALIALYKEIPQADQSQPEPAQRTTRPETFAIGWQQEARPSLQRHFINYAAYIQDKTNGFVGREHVIDAFDQFLDGYTSGYFVVRGDPGIGKSAIAAELVRTRGYPHHFNIAAEGISGINQFRRNLAAQVIARYRLDYLDLPADVEQDNNFLKQIMAEAAVSAGESPVVLVVDALDEVSDEASGRANPLSLPRSLPANVFILVTTRRTDSVLEIDVEHSQVLELEAGSAGNLQDIRAYIDAYARRPAMQKRLAAWRVDRDTFVEKLQVKSEGNFMYVRYVLPAIAAGKFTHGTVDELPRGLRRYYKRHWETMRGQDREAFVRVNQKVIAVLATAYQPVSIQFVARVTRLEPAEVQWTIDQWREFLHVLTGNGARRFRLYHASYRDFLAGQVAG